jgi:multimeric flavodoxin WrbA
MIVVLALRFSITFRVRYQISGKLTNASLRRRQADMRDKILGVGGSPRRGGNSDMLLQSVLSGAEESGAETEAIFLRNYAFSSCVGCEACRRDGSCTRLLDGVQLIYPEVRRARGLVLASPVHFYNASALMKAFIDRLYCFFDFTEDHPRHYSSRLAGEGRKAVVAAVCEQLAERDMGFTREAMRWPLQALGYEITDEVSAYGFFAKGRVARSEETLRRCVEAGRSLARALA